ncbi:hypothetical protein N406_07900 [Helicobacter pylori FD577]|nr:hypothetical protein N201_07200 [Helicobacter pylori UM066]EQL63096.1 hypothetical protein N406_07900 [Helicobacter pylori FD577]
MWVEFDNTSKSNWFYIFVSITDGLCKITCSKK